MRESVAMGETITTHINSTDNPADLLTKVICGSKRKQIVHNLLHDVYDGEMRPYAIAK